jgi:hypothetical protein
MFHLVTILYYLQQLIQYKLYVKPRVYEVLLYYIKLLYASIQALNIFQTNNLTDYQRDSMF